MSKFKVGDKVKVIKAIIDTDKPLVGKVFTVVSTMKVTDTMTTYNIDCDDVIGLIESQLELVEPKEEKKVAKHVRCINDKYTNGILENGKVYKVIDCSNDLIKLANVPLAWAVERFVDYQPKPAYPIIEHIHGTKVVFNPPYTIVEFTSCGGKLTGKAKCNPSDTYDKWEGYKLAYQRMLEAPWIDIK